MTVWWPAYPEGGTYTAVWAGWNNTPVPWGHSTTIVTGWRYTISFGKSVKNVRVYARAVDYSGGVVQFKNAAGVLLAEKPIPIQDTSFYARDTIAYADTGVRTVEIIPALDPNFPPQRETLIWQAQFEPPPPPPLCLFADSLSFPQDLEPLNDTTIRRSLDSLLAKSNILDLYANRHEEIAVIRRNPDGTFRVDPIDFTIVHQCASRLTTQADEIMKSDPTIVAFVHTHPFRTGDVPLCPTGEDYMYDPIGQHGMSGPDFRSKGDINKARGSKLIPPVPFYVVDLDYVYYIPRTGTQSSDDFQYKRRGPDIGCRWR